MFIYINVSSRTHQCLVQLQCKKNERTIHFLFKINHVFEESFLILNGQDPKKNGLIWNARTMYILKLFIMYFNDRVNFKNNLRKI